MAKKDTDHGADNLNAALSGKTSLSDISKEQLAYLGGEVSDIDTEDFKDADFGNSFDPNAEAEDEPEEKGEEDDEKEGEAEEDDEKAEKGEEADEKDGDEAEEDEAAKEEDKDDESEDAEAKDDKAEDEEDEAAKEEDKDDEKDESEEDDGKKDKGKAQTVPLPRFREVNKKMRELERELAQIKNEQAAGKGKDPEAEEKPYDFDKAESEAMDLLLDGKKADYTAKRREIRAAERAELDRSVKVTSSDTVDVKQNKAIMDGLAEVYAERYPVMDIDHPDFNPAVNKQISATMMGFIHDGEQPAAAFKSALDLAVKSFGLVAVVAEGSEEEDKGGKGESKKDAKGKKEEKKREKTKAKIEKKKKAPPDTRKAGGAGDEGGEAVFDINEATDAEIEALPLSKLKRLRGDLV